MAVLLHILACITADAKCSGNSTLLTVETARVPPLNNYYVGSRSIAYIGPIYTRTRYIAGSWGIGITSIDLFNDSVA